MSLGTYFRTSVSSRLPLEKHTLRSGHDHIKLPVNLQAPCQT